MHQNGLFLLYVQVSIGYKKPKRVILTPLRKRVGKAIARGSRKAVAEQCFKDPSTKKYLLEVFGREIRKDIRHISSSKTPSCLRYSSPEDLCTFTWDKLLTELSTGAPTLLEILRAATRKRIPRSNTIGVICMCAGIILKHHNPTLSLVQKILTVILFAGHVSKQVSRSIVA